MYTSEQRLPGRVWLSHTTPHPGQVQQMDRLHIELDEAAREAAALHLNPEGGALQHSFNLVAEPSGGGANLLPASATRNERHPSVIVSFTTLQGERGRYRALTGSDRLPGITRMPAFGLTEVEAYRSTVHWGTVQVPTIALLVPRGDALRPPRRLTSKRAPAAAQPAAPPEPSPLTVEALISVQNATVVCDLPLQVALNLIVHHGRRT